MNESSSAETRVLTVSEWFITILILALPLVNIVMYLYWALADGVNHNKRNFCRASIAWTCVAIGIVLMIVMMGGFAALLGSGN